MLAGRTVDFTGRRGGDIVADLGERDFTVNAMAMPVAADADADVIDPFGGLADLAEGRLRLVSDRVFTDDPLRLLRLARIAHELGFTVDPGAERLARRDAHLADRSAGERIYAEMRRLLTPDHPDVAVRVLDGLGVLDVILPEAIPMRGCEQSPFHHLDVFEHTLQVLDAAADIAAHPDHYLPRHADAIRVALDEPVGDELDARTALRFAVLFHDIEKPSTRTVSDRGRIGFMGHDRKGAETTGRILKRWRAATSTIRFCALLVAEHLRLGFMVHDRPLDRRAGYRYLRPPSRTRRRASWCRSPTGLRRAASARGSRTSAPTPRRPTSCFGSSPSSSTKTARRCFAATRSPSSPVPPGPRSACWWTRWRRSRRQER